MSESLISFYSHRIIAFHRGYVELTGSVTAALLLGQACYWSKRSEEQKGWFYKTREEWQEELGLSRKEQETARTLLRKLPFWQEKLESLPAKLYFRVDFQALTKYIESQEPLSSEVAPEPDPQTESPSSQLVGHKVANWPVTKSPTGRSQSGQHIIRNTKSTSIDDFIERSMLDTKGEEKENIDLSQKEKISLQTQPLSCWDEPKIAFYRVLFAFHGACKDSLGLGPLLLDTGHPEEFPGALPQSLEQSCTNLFRSYAKQAHFGFLKLRENMIKLGEYIGHKKPFVFRNQPVLSLQELCEKPQWFQKWMAEALLWEAAKDPEVIQKQRPKETVPTWKQDPEYKKLQAMNEMEREEHYSSVKETLRKYREKYIEAN